MGVPIFDLMGDPLAESLGPLSEVQTNMPVPSRGENVWQFMSFLGKNGVCINNS